MPITMTPKYATMIALAREHRTTIFDGAVGAGKTTAANVCTVDNLRTSSLAGLYLGIGSTTDTLHSNVLSPLQSWLGNARCKIGTAKAPTGTILNRQWLFRGAPNLTAVGRAKGLTLIGAVIDEVTEIPEPFWYQLGYRMRGADRTWVIGTTNPGSPGHWLYPLLLRARTIIEHDGSITRRDDSWRDENGQPALDLLWGRFTMADNPSLPASFVEDVLRQNPPGTARHARNVQGLWVAAEGVIYDRYSEALHVIEDNRLPRDPAGRVTLTNWHLVVDHGTTAPTNAGLYGWHAATGTLIKCREWRYDSKAAKATISNQEIMNRLIRWADSGFDGLLPPGSLPLRQVRFVHDPAANGFAAAARQQVRGMMVVAADNSVQDGIEDVNSLLASGRLLINRKCTYTLAEIVAYVWDEKQQARGVDAPLKKDDHAMDETRYTARVTRPLWTRATAQPLSPHPVTAAA
jgi:hypothetical protein